jgi:hypothetical protein
LVKTFIAGIILGIAAGGAALYFIPVVDQYRERSMISVAPNGGNRETFHINIPMDRIMVGAADQPSPLPVGLEWPEVAQFGGLRVELFKVRNGKDAVIGVASRMAASSGATGDTIEWVLHMPARGSIYVTMRPEAVDGGYRLGEVRSGTREFDTLLGALTERWIADASGSDDAPAGRIELQTSLVAQYDGSDDDDAAPSSAATEEAPR